MRSASNAVAPTAPIVVIWSPTRLSCLQLSGHTHAGQIFPFTTLVKIDQPYVRGLHRHEATQIYVSEGTGYWGPPMRLGTWAEITTIELVPT